jgi:hypothetical protein
VAGGRTRLQFRLGGRRLFGGWCLGTTRFLHTGCIQHFAAIAGNSLVRNFDTGVLVQYHANLQSFSNLTLNKAVIPLLKIDNENHEVGCFDMFLRRLGPDPHLNGAQTKGLSGCPDVFELETGDFAIIGKDVTIQTIGKLPASASCGPDEKIVVIPRKTLVGAKPDIPDSV